MNTSLCYICLVLQSAGWNICFSNPKYCTLFDIFSWRLWFQWTAKPLTVSLTSVMHVAMAPHGWQPVPASLTTSFCFWYFTVIFLNVFCNTSHSMEISDLSFTFIQATSLIHWVTHSQKKKKIHRSRQHTLCGKTWDLCWSEEKETVMQSWI